MKYTPILVAAWFALAAAASAADYAPAQKLSEGRTVSIAHRTDADGAPRVYCYTGVRAEPEVDGVQPEPLYRGWICVPEAGAAAAR